MAKSEISLPALTRLFSSTVFRELAAKGKSPLFARLLTQGFSTERLRGLDSVSGAFDAAFAILRDRGNRDEYIYKAALTHRVLLGTHSLRTACMLNEFRVGPCKADLAILNGTGTVYEIKSERDSLSRLARQVDWYKRAFAKVYVVASEKHVPEVMSSTTDDVGVMVLSPRYRISTVREATDQPDRTCPVTIFESLRKNEAKLVLKCLGFSIPDVPNTRLHAELRQQFETLQPSDVHSAMVEVLKKTRNLLPLASLVDQLPTSLQPAALSVSVRRADHDRLVSAVKTPLDLALNWA